MMAIPPNFSTAGHPMVILLDKVSVVDISVHLPLLHPSDQLCRLLATDCKNLGEALGVLQQKVLQPSGALIAEAYNKVTKTCCGAGVWAIYDGAQRMGPSPKLDALNFSIFGKQSGLAVALYQHLFDFAKVHMEKKQCLFLQVMGVQQNKQGCRVGRNIINAGLAEADKQNLQCFTVARRSTEPFFQKYGFSRVKTARIDLASFGTPAEGWGEYELIFLLRKPPASSSQNQGKVVKKDGSKSA